MLKSFRDYFPIDAKLEIAMDTTSYWQDTSSLPQFPSLKQDIRVDVAIIGGGITGITAAYLLTKAGYKIALIERARCGGFDTSHTTAHLTRVTDTPLRELVNTFGRDRAKLVWDAGGAAIDQIDSIIRSEKLDAEFVWVPGYYHAPLKRNGPNVSNSLKKEAKIANELGFPARFMDPVPFVNVPGVKFLHQAKFHPTKYLSGLLRILKGSGANVFENTPAEEVEEKPFAVKAGAHKVKCSYLILATHNPLMGKSNLLSATLLQSKLFLYTSYVVGARLPAGVVPEASFWDTSEPYYYLRVDPRRGFDYAIFGGEDHKTGQVNDTAGAYRRLEATLHRLIPEAQVDHRWSCQVIETPDGLPFIGQTADRQFVATGFGGNGMTFGTLGAMMAVDAFRKRDNPWSELFDVHRKKVRGGALHYLKENKDYPYYLLRDRLARAEGTSPRSIRRGEGKILKLDGQKVAAYRTENGDLSLLSPVCTHLGCIIHWNEVERTWDCPCHGSRFAPTGEVLSGPAEEPLEKVPHHNESVSRGAR
jgi:glycine/D-amino acid oxidase-like deaminating enzyme/nitrite reductase/ring-hydroxylating ferredoxin subunit